MPTPNSGLRISASSSHESRPLIDSARQFPTVSTGFSSGNASPTNTSTSSLSTRLDHGSSSVARTTHVGALQLMSSEIPKIKIVQKTVEIPRVREVIKTVPIVHVVEVERQRFTRVPVHETKTVEREIEVMGEVIEVPKPFVVENRIVTPRFIDVPVPTVVTQTLRPVFVESDDHVVQVLLREYEPEVIPVDIYLPRPIDRHIVIAGNTTRNHIPVSIPLPHYNALILELNKKDVRKAGAEDDSAVDEINIKTSANHVPNDEISATADAAERDISEDLWRERMLQSHTSGAVPLLNEEVMIVPPFEDDWKEAYKQGKEYILPSSVKETPVDVC